MPTYYWTYNTPWLDLMVNSTDINALYSYLNNEQTNNQDMYKKQIDVDYKIDIDIDETNRNNKLYYLLTSSINNCNEIVLKTFIIEIKENIIPEGNAYRLGALALENYGLFQTEERKNIVNILCKFYHDNNLKFIGDVLWLNSGLQRYYSSYNNGNDKSLIDLFLENDIDPLDELLLLNRQDLNEYLQNNFGHLNKVIKFINKSHKNSF